MLLSTPAPPGISDEIAYSVLPVGSVVRMDIRDEKYDGIYTVLDTGPAVQGREVDIYMWSCNEALQFGRKPAQLTIMRLGWSPLATTPGLIERFLHRPQAPKALPARPLPLIEVPAGASGENVDAWTAGGG